MSEIIPLDDIIVDPEIQPRKQLDESAVQEYTDLMRDSKSASRFPDLIVFQVGARYLLADGFHRLEARRWAGCTNARCVVRQGTKRDAVFWAAGANTDHGVRRTNEDKRRVVGKLLSDEEWSTWSDRRIADHVGVSHNLVSDERKKRPQLSSDDSSKAEPAKRVGKDGRTRKVPKEKTTAQKMYAAKKKNERMFGPRPAELHSPTVIDVASKATKCPNCGHDASDDDGDCLRCKEPNIGAVAPSRTSTLDELADPEALAPYRHYVYLTP